MDGPGIPERTPEEEIVPRGREIYELRVRPRMRPQDEGAFVVIDVESGHHEVAREEEAAFSRAEEARPGALFYVLRVGEGGEPLPAYRIGAGELGAGPRAPR